jgi:class 3 adenylate cyclase
MTAALAVATFGTLNFVAARQLLVQGTESQLAAIGATRAASIEAGAERLVAETSVAGSDRSTARALQDFARAFAELATESLAPEQRAELEDFYRDRIVEPLNEAGLGLYEVDALVPSTPAAAWVQYHYTLRPRGEAPPADAGDGTEYSRLNAAFTDVARAFSDSAGGGDVLLIDESGTVVYSLDKRNDVGTNLVTGPYSEGALAQVVTNSLPRARVGKALLTDFAVSASGRPSLFAVTSLSTGTQVVGALAVEIPVASLNRMASAGGEWAAIGLGPGDSYIVGSGSRLQSEPRAWLDDPEAYLERLRSGDESDQAEAALIELFGSPVGIQVIDTPPVRAALDGAEFRGAAQNYFGDSTFAASASFRPGGQQWAVVTEVPRSVILAPLMQYLRQILLVLGIVLPIVAGLGGWLSRLLVRPIQPTVDAAEAIARGTRAPAIDTARRDEFGDLGRRLSAMADELAASEADLTEEYERTRALLLAVLPPKLVDEGGKIVGTGAAAQQATIVAVTLVPPDEHQDPGLLEEALRRAAELAELVAVETGLERVRVSADRYLFVAGLGSPGAGADVALDFVEGYRRRLASDGVEIDLGLHVGLSSGPVATGVLDTGSLTFGAWGEPVRRALALASLSQVDGVLIDATTALACTSARKGLKRAHDVVDLDDEQMDLYTLAVSDETTSST